MIRPRERKIRLCNRGKIAMKAVARVPPSLRGCASFSPDMGFVQPGSFFEFGLRFRPDPESLARCAKDGWGVLASPPLPPPPLLPQPAPSSAEDRGADGGIKNEAEAEAGRGGGGGGGGVPPAAGDSPGDGGMIVIPLRFDVPGQALPARSVLQARLTGWDVEVRCQDAGREAGGEGGREGASGGQGGNGGGGGGGGGGGAVVSFGQCFVGQSISRRVSLRNTSMLPARFGFVGNPPEVSRQELKGRVEVRGAGG